MGFFGRICSDAGTSDWDPPTSYNGYDKVAVTLAESSAPQVPLDFTKTAPITSSTVSGSVKFSALAWENDAYVHFADNASLQVIYDTHITGDKFELSAAQCP